VRCGSHQTTKRGKARGVQTYLSLDCGRRFSDERRKKNVLIKRLWEDYVFHKQTVRGLLCSYKPPNKVHHPRSVHLVVDATYFGEKKEGTSWCIVVARDHEQGEDLVWRFASTESTGVYGDIRTELEDLGYTIQSVIGDGFSGIRSAFHGIPYQMCHVHMERIVTRGTTRNPQTEAGQVLLALTRSVHNTTKKIFTKRLNKYILFYQDFLNERTTNPVTKETYWTHKELRKAVLSLIHHKPYLFTYAAHTHIAKTTNSLEGRFSHINEVTAIHRGLSKQQKKKVIHSLLLASTVAPNRNILDQIL